MGAGLWWPDGPAAATLGLVIIAPECQGQGLGRHLVESLLGDAGDRAVKLIATQAGRPLYERLGFRDVGTIHHRQGRCSAGPVSHPLIRAAQPGDVASLVALDCAAFGAQRGALVERLLNVGRAVVYEGDGEPAGFAVVRVFGHGQLIGPVVAPDESVASALVRAAARPGFVRLDVPAGAPVLAESLEEMGLTVVDAPVVMVRGDWPPSESQRGFALVSQALG